MKTNLLIVDDHPMVCEALETRISMEDDLNVCGTVSSEQEAIAVAKELMPELMLIDITLESGNGIELVKRIHSLFPKIKMLVISAFSESLYAERALRAGAKGYLNKQESSENVIVAIRTVLEGKHYVSEEITRRLLNQVLDDPAPQRSPVDKLSDRELEVFQLIGQGIKGSAIASKLHLSTHTIDTYREKIKSKIGAKNGVELQREAIRWFLQNEQDISE